MNAISACCSLMHLGHTVFLIGVLLSQKFSVKPWKTHLLLRRTEACSDAGHQRDLLYLYCKSIVVKVTSQRFLGHRLHKLIGETLKHPTGAGLCRKTGGGVSK